MSDLCMYELEDILWNEFGQSDDHIVPHAVKEHWDGCAVESYNLKRTRCGVTGVASNAETIMLEEGSWSQSSDGDFIASYDDDSNKMALSSASDDNRNIRHCLKSSHVEPIGNELCADDPILGEQDAPMDNTLYHYPPHHVTSTENFFNSDIQDKENSDLFYGWPDIENFEDVDRMFRSCDSTFGLGIDDEQDFGLFSYSHDIEGSNDELKSSFKFSGSDSNVFSSVTKPGEELNNTAPFVGDNDKKLTPSSWKTSSPSLDAEGPSAGVHTTFLPEPKTISDIDRGQKINLHEGWTKHKKPSVGKRKTCHLENGNSSIHIGNLKQSGTRQQQQFLHHNGLLTQICFANGNSGHPSNKVLASQTLSRNKSDSSCCPLTSQEEFSYTSNPMQSAESSDGISFRTPPVTGDKKKGPPCYRHKLSIHPEDLMVQTANCDQVSFLKKAPNFEGLVEGHSEVNGSGTRIQAEIDPSNVQEICMSSLLDEVSLEASSFRQLQNVMEQLDTRTKLCIRDSLYRLAMSAEQRHKCANRSREDKDGSGALTSDEMNKCTGFMDMETNTNPIDRSIAHLLFHRPTSHPSSVPALDVSPVASCLKVNAPCNGHLLKAENVVSQEEIAPAARADLSSN